METKQLVDFTPDKRFALLIDADNVSAKYIKPILTELSKYGTITYKRIYGDWTLSLHAKWKDALLENSITPIQQFSYTYGKNSTDSAMIIDAMDILYAESVEGFCIVSSDSDFTRLASRLRESGRTVIGMGEKKTPTPFRKACDIFTVLELLVKNERNEKANGPTMSKSEVEQAVVDIIIDNQNNGKATGLGEIGSRLQKRYPDFDVRNYGTNLLSKLLSEFSRVKITKDHSSVAVELVENPELDKHEKTAQPEKIEKHEKTERAEKADKGDKHEKAEKLDKSDKAEKPEKPEKPEKRSDKPGKLEKYTAAEESAPEAPAEAAGEGESAQAEEKDARPARKPRRKRKITVEKRQREVSGLAGKHDAGEGEPAATEAAAEPATAEAATEPSAAESAVVEPAADTPAASEPAAVEPAPEATPESIIRECIVAAGEQGIALTQIGDKVKAQFKDFKVRDLGFAQLRLYIASIEDFETFKSDKTHCARLKP